MMLMRARKPPENQNPVEEDVQAMHDQQRHEVVARSLRRIPVSAKCEVGAEENHARDARQDIGFALGGDRGAVGKEGKDHRNDDVEQCDSRQPQ